MPIKVLSKLLFELSIFASAITKDEEGNLYTMKDAFLPKCILERFCLQTRNLTITI